MNRTPEQTYTTWDLDSFTPDFGCSDRLFRWDEERLYLLSCELDTALSYQYVPAKQNDNWCPAKGVTANDLARLNVSFATPRDAVAYIFVIFLTVRRRGEGKYECNYRTKRVILEIYDAMQAFIRTGQPYQTRLNSPPGPPGEPLADWPPGAPCPANWPPHIHHPRHSNR